MLVTRLGNDLASHGAASLLIHQYLANGQPLPDDDARLAMLASCGEQEWQSVSTNVRKLFYRGEDGKLHQEECDDMLEEAAEFLTMKRNQGSLGGRAKAEARKIVPSKAKEHEIV
jgi:uncharacterized protein YdaU (DUF1376 family)